MLSTKIIGNKITDARKKINISQAGKADLTGITLLTLKGGIE